MTVSPHGYTARLRAAIAILALIGAPTIAHAESWDFNSTPTGLNYYDPFASFGTSATFTVPGADGTLRVQNSNSALLDNIFGAGAGTARAGVYGNATYTDFVSSVDLVGFDPTVDQAAVLGARGQNIGLGTTNGYFAGITYGGGGFADTFVFIGRSDAEQITELNGQLVAIDPTHDYRIDFRGTGSLLQTMVFDITGTPNLIADLSVTDSTYSSGQIGAFAIGIKGETTPVDVTFDNLTASAVTVPETSTLGLLAVGVGGAVLGIVRRKRSSTV